MTTSPAHEARDSSVITLARLLRERDELFLLQEALADVERAHSFDERVGILVAAIRRVGYGRVETVTDYPAPDGTAVAEWISNSAFLNTGELIVPLRSVVGITIATLVLGDPDEPGPPPLTRVRTVELFAQRVASMIENARLYEKSERERRRGEALADIARAVSSSLRLADVLDLSLRHAMALLHTRGAGIGLLRDDQIILVAGNGSASSLIGAPIPLRASISGIAILERRTVICNNANVEEAYAPSRIAADVERTLVAPLFSIEGVIGTLSVIDRGSEFTTDDAEILQRLGDQVAVAISNARLFEEERERALALQRSEVRYSRLVESASDAIFTADASGLMTAVNRSLERSSGKTRADLLATHFTSLIDSRDHAAADQAIDDTFRGQRRRVELRWVNAAGERRLCSLTLTPLTEGGGEEEIVTGALGIIRDVTDEKRLAEQLMQQEKLAAVGQLVSGVAHELNNPLASVMAFAQLLLAAPGDAPQDRGALDAIHQETKRAARIVANLLTFARQHQPERRVADLNQVVDDTLELRRYALRIAQIEIETELDSTLPLTWADPFQLQQVVLNLVTNAEQALTSWMGPRTIRVTTGMSGDLIVIRVGDTGPGIATEHMPRIFNPFFTTKPVGEGTGLGLSISDGIVREHGGRIRVESCQGQGATFVIELPYVAPPEPGTPVDTPVVQPRTPSRRILLVDDEQTLCRAVARFFRSLGHEVDTAGTGREAVTRASVAEYDVVMLDLRLPDMTGDDVLTELRSIQREPDRVVFITGDTQSELARSLLEAGGYSVVSKPFVLDELAAVVLAEST